MDFYWQTILVCFFFLFLLDDSDKWQQHLSLLREQYVKLHAAHSELQNKFAALNSGIQQSGFVHSILSAVAALHRQNDYYRYLLLTLLKIFKNILNNIFYFLKNNEHNFLFLVTWRFNCREKTFLRINLFWQREMKNGPICHSKVF